MTAVEKLRRNGIDISIEVLAPITREFRIAEFSVFGSSIRDAGVIPQDIDLLVTFQPDARISLFDLMDLEKRLEEVFKRPVDLVEPQARTNPTRRRNILAKIEPLFAA